MVSNIRLRELLHKYLRNNCSEYEFRLLLDYLKRAENEPEVKKILNNYRRDIDEEKILGEPGVDFDRDEWFEEIYSKVGKIDDSLNDVSNNPKSRTQFLPSTRNHIPLWLRIAAILLITFTASYLVLTSGPDSPEDVSAYSQKVAEAGEKVRFVLPDGTQVHLNSESRLTFPDKFLDTVREVRLQGEGYFVVAEDKDRPFLVQTKKITTKVLGTSFSVRSYPEDNRAVVAVRSGKVSVAESDSANRTASVILEPNEYANYTFTNRQFTTGEGISALTAWNSGILLYHNKELGEVAFQLERWYGVNITFLNESIKKCVVRGEHREESLSNVLEAITYAFDVEYKIEERQVLLYGSGCH